MDIAVEAPQLAAADCGTYRLLGTVGMIGAPMIGLALILGLAGRIKMEGREDAALSAAYMLGFLCTAAGLRGLRAMGCGRTARIISNIQITAAILAEIWALITLVDVPFAGRSVVIKITDFAWPFSHLFMLVVAWAMYRARRWTGWRLRAAFLCGFALPAGMAAGPVFGHSAVVLVFSALTAVGFLMLANSIRTTQGLR